jgi:sugar phosphate permease
MEGCLLATHPDLAPGNSSTMSLEAGQSLAIPQQESFAPPTSVRYQVLGLLGAMTFILYLDRVCWGQAKQAVALSLGLIDARGQIDTVALAWIDNAFLISYGLFEVPAGNLGDRYGSRRMLAFIVLAWSLFTGLTGAALSFWMLLVVRFVFGMGEAGALPNAARVLRQWFPESRRGRAQGVVTTCMLLGGTIAPVAAAFLIDRIGWRLSFVAFGTLGLVWVAAFYWYFRDDPREHPGVNESEGALIAEGRPPEEHGSHGHPPIPWKLVLRSPNVWLMGGLINCGAAVFYLVIHWYPTYLKEGRGLNELSNGEVLSGLLSSVVIGGGALGCILGGILTDYLLRRTGNLRKSRCWLGSASFFVGALAWLAGLQFESAVPTTLCHAVAHLCVQLAIPAWWATVTRISGRHVGALFGLMNSLGIIGAAGLPFLWTCIVDHLKHLGRTGSAQWDPGMYMFSGIMVVGGILWLLVNPGRSLVESDAAAAR